MIAGSDVAGNNLCRHFGECGGCKTQDVGYPEQLQRKSAAMSEWFATVWDGDIAVTGSPVLWYYRNKVEFSFGRMQYPEAPPAGFIRESVVGFKKGGRWYHTLDIRECLIGPKGAGELLDGIRGWMAAGDIRSWHDRTGDGSLRWLMLREARGTGERMVVLTTRSKALDCDGVMEVVRKCWPATTVVHAVNDRDTDSSYTDDLTVLAGSGSITETLQVPGCPKALAFRISPMSFFQTNTAATELLYGRIREWVAEAAPSLVYDLYGGAGGIAFAIHDLVQQVVSVESVVSATEDGNFNAAVNGITNVRFETADVRAWLKTNGLKQATMSDDSLVVLDPPRSALHPKVIRRLLEQAPPEIIYVSCNPKLLAQELVLFAERYDLVALEAFDLFPHTPHVEALARLRRRD